jgi:hypothetical protein
MTVEVDTHSREGERLPPSPTRAASKQETRVFDALGAAADARVAEIIARNSGKAAEVAAGHGRER